MTVTVDSRSFRAAREQEWRYLDALLVTCEKKSPRALADLYSLFAYIATDKFD